MTVIVITCLISQPKLRSFSTSTNYNLDTRLGKTQEIIFPSQFITDKFSLYFYPQLYCKLMLSVLHVPTSPMVLEGCMGDPDQG